MQPEKSTAHFFDTPNGIITVSGVWFRTTVALLEQFAAPVFEQIQINKLIARAEVWLRSPETVALWLLPVFLVALPPVPAFLALLVVYVGWKSLSPALVTWSLSTLFNVIDKVILQALYYVFVLSLFAAQNYFAAVGVGIVGFILLRWGIIHWATQAIVKPIWQSLYPVTVPDQVLRALIIRAALRYGVAMPEIDAMEQQIFDTWHRD